MTTDDNNQPTAEITILLRVPYVRDEEADGDVSVSIDLSLETLRKRMKEGLAGKIDEDQLVIFRLLQAAGVEYWPLRESDL